MLESVIVKSGKWYVETSGELHGEVGSGFRGLAIAGTLTDTNYYVQAIIRAVKGTKASLIAFYTDETTVKYLELTLDFSTNKIKLDKVENEVRTNVAEVSYTLSLATEYNCKLVASSNITCIINGATVIEKSVAGYTAGKHGFACDGSIATDYSLFNQICFQKPTYYTDLDTLISSIRSVDPKDLVGKDGTPQDYYDYLVRLIEQASRFVDGECDRENGFFQKDGITITEYHDGMGSSPPTGLYKFGEEKDTWQESARRIFLNSKPVLDITSIHENVASIGQIDDWNEITSYRWKNNEIVFSPDAIPAKGFKNVRVTYKAGYSETPLDIQMACTRLITNMIHKLISDRTATFVSFARPTAINFAMPEIFTPDIRMVLKRYKLMGYGEM